MMACWLGGTSEEKSLDFGILEKLQKFSNDGHDGLMVTVIERRVRGDSYIYIDSCRGTNVVVACRKKSRMMAWWLGGTSQVESLYF